MEINGKQYQFNNSIQYKKEFKLERHCVINNNNRFMKNMVSDSNKICDNTIICKKIKSNIWLNSCDDNQIDLTGNYLIIANNCSIQIDNLAFNNKVKYVDLFFYFVKKDYNFSK